MTTNPYDDWHAERVDEGDTYTGAPWHIMAKAHLGDIAGLRVLEIGCGRGAFAHYLVEQGAVLTAADFSQVAVDAARRLLADKAECLVADIEALPFPDGHFDLVVSLETLEHIPNPDRGLGELVRVTRTGGNLLITTPNYLSLIGISRVLLRLMGRRFTEVGQPINQPLMLYKRVRSLKALGCRVDQVDGSTHSLLIPGFKTMRIDFLERPHRVTKWFARHGLTYATKLELK